MSKTYVIGDIHGGLKALQVLLDESPFEEGKDQLIFIGDLIDGWSDSLALIDFLIRLQQKTNCIFIRGNHDYFAQQFLENKKAPPAWLEHGGSGTYQSYLDNPAKHDAHRIFYQNMPNFHIDAKNNLFVHAGFVHENGPTHDKRAVLNEDRSLLKEAMACNAEGNTGPKRSALFQKIFIGHTPTFLFDTTEPVKAGNVIDVDTGVALMGPLTIMEVNSEEYWQSKPVWQYYPLEKGRNKKLPSSIQQ